MKISVIVNSYNYARYIGETLDSVLAQTLPADEIVIVDDGSQDESCAVIDGYVDRHQQMQFIRKTNGGQLSTFNAAASAVSGEVVFFIDSDDTWQPDYLQKIVAIYRQRPVDFVFCAFQEFGESTKLCRKYPRDTDLGFSTAFTYFKKVYIGGPTATLSLRRALFDKIFPVGLESDWRVCADLPLVMGASLAGGHKYYCAEPLVRYRIHKINAHKVLEGLSDYDYRFAYTRDGVINYFSERFHLNEKTCADLLCDEVQVCREDMRLGLLWRYATALLKLQRPWFWKCSAALKLLAVAGKLPGGRRPAGTKG